MIINKITVVDLFSFLESALEFDDNPVVKTVISISLLTFLLANASFAQAIDYSLCRGFFKNHFNIEFGNKDFTFYSGTGEIRPRTELNITTTALNNGDRILYQYPDDDWNRFEYLRRNFNTFRWKWTTMTGNAHSSLQQTLLENPSIERFEVKYRVLTFRIHGDRCLPGELMDVTETAQGPQYVLQHNDEMCKELKNFNQEKGIPQGQLWATDFELKELAVKYWETPHLSRLLEMLTTKEVDQTVNQRDDKKIIELLTNVQHLCQDNGYYGPLEVSEEARKAADSFDLIKDDWYRPDSPYTYQHWTVQKKKKVFIPPWGYVP